MYVFTTDLSRFDVDGMGTVTAPPGTRLYVGDVVTVTDGAAVVLEADVVDVRDREADVRIRGDRIPRQA